MSSPNRPCHERIQKALDLPAEHEQLVLLGGNPLPAVVFALATRPLRTHIVATKDVEALLGRVERLLESKGLGLGERIVLDSPRDAARIRQQLQQGRISSLWGRAGLHYSGGTKVMAAHAYQLWRQSQSEFPASYLGPDAQLRFELEHEDRLFDLRDEPRLTLQELCDLHLGASKLECDDLHLHDKPSPRGIDQQLEADIAKKLHEASGLFHSVNQSVKVRPREGGNLLFEADVVAIRGYTAYLFSCTTSGNGSEGKTRAKLKLFEARQRADQLGGEHARAAIVSHHPHPFQLLETVKQGWSGHDDARAFGPEHINGDKARCASDGPQETFNDGVRRWVMRDRQGAAR